MPQTNSVHSRLHKVNTPQLNVNACKSINKTCYIKYSSRKQPVGWLVTNATNSTQNKVTGALWQKRRTTHFTVNKVTNWWHRTDIRMPVLPMAHSTNTHRNANTRTRTTTQRALHVHVRTVKNDRTVVRFYILARSSAFSMHPRARDVPVHVP